MARSIPPLPDPRIIEFDDGMFSEGVMSPTWREFWVRLLAVIGDLNTGQTAFVLGNFANDAAAAAGGVLVGQLYRNGSIVQIRVT